MASRNLEYSRDNINFGQAVDIVRHEIEENSSFETEVTGQSSDMSRTIKSSMNVANVLRLSGIIRVELKGQEFVLDAVQKALDSQANETGQKVPRGGQPENQLGGTGPNEQQFTPSEPPEISQPGEDIEDKRDWYILVHEDWSVEVEPSEEGMDPATDRTTVEEGPYDQRTTAQVRANEIRQAYEQGNADEVKDILDDRYWSYSQDEWWLVDAMTQDGRRGKLQMPAELAKEAERFGYVKIVEKYIPDTHHEPMVEGPDYLREEGVEGWEGIFRFLQKHPGTEPEVPSPMTDERVPQSQAEKEGRLNVAEHQDPQAIAHIYENGVVSVNRDGSVETLDTIAGFFIDRETNEPALGYIDEYGDLTRDDVEQIVRAVRRSLMDEVNNNANE